MTVIERIVILSKEAGSVEKFAEECGINPGSLRNAIQRKSEVKESTIEAIIKNFPTLNLRWLLLGEGEMYVNESTREDGDLSGQEVNEPQTEYIKRLNDLLEKRVNELERELKLSDPDKAKELGID